LRPQNQIGHNTTNSHNPNHSNNTNNITISLGNENLSDVLSLQEQINILKQKNEALETLIKHVHFNKKYPQFHNIAIDDNKGYIYDETSKKFTEVPKEELMMDIIESRMNDICDFNDDNRMRLSRKKYEYMKSYINMFNINHFVNKKMECVEPIIYSGTQRLLDSKKIII